MRRLVPKSRMAIFGLVLLVLWVMKALLLTPRVRYHSPGFAFLLDILTPLLVIPAIYYLWRFSRYARNKLLWRIRRRLILAYVFMGAIPILIAIGIFYFSALLFYYQLSYYLISNQIGIHSAQIHAFNLSFREGLEKLIMEQDPADPDSLKQMVDSDAKYILSYYPTASIILRFSDPASKRPVVYGNKGMDPQMLQDYRIPQWLEEGDFSGLVLQDSLEEINADSLFLKSFVSSGFGYDFPFSIEVSVPFDQYMLDRLKSVLGQDLLLARQTKQSGRSMMLQGADILQENVSESTFDSPRARHETGSLWKIFLFPTSWSTGLESTGENSDVIAMELSIAKLIRNLYRHESVIGKRILGVLQTTTIFFLLAEIASIVIGILLSKSITNAVHSLDRGTQFIKQGDFSHRIIVKSQDELGALASSFNQMTEYVQQLVKERVEKERLERELEIANEVQKQLFPNRAPQMNRIDVAGVCLPARIVSGDYYDFLPLGAHELGLAVGDICGKGISAALLMANLQATLRSNVMNLLSQGKQNGDKSVAEIVERLNRQIYGYTAANKFASFFYALYDESRQTLTYSNAGHNPPLFFAGDEVRRLSDGGTILGIFYDSKYDQETIHLNEGDILVAYTDGIVESVNQYGEDFGEIRLIQLIRENRHLSAEGMKNAMVDSILSWVFKEEREDDMTLIIAKILKGKEHTDDPESNALTQIIEKDA